MYKKNFSRLFLFIATIGTLSTVTMGAQTVHLDVDFTTGSINNLVGSFDIIPGNNNFGIQTASSWRTGTYFGPPKASAFTTPWGTGAYMSSTMANTAPGAAGVAKLAPGNVWVIDESMISDVAVISGGNNFLDRSPGFGGFSTASDNFNTGALFKVQADGDRSVVAGAGPDAGDVTTEANVLPTGLGADTSAALNQVMHAKLVYQPAPAGGLNPAGYSTKISVQALTPTLPITTTWHYDGASGGAAAGNFRTDYSSGLYIFGINSIGDHPTDNVTYASGVTGLAGDNRVGVPFQQTGNLELGLTHLTFKQVANTDFNTDGITNVSNDATTLLANLGGTGKSFFQGDTNGDGLVNVSTDATAVLQNLGTDLVGAGTAMAKLDANGHVLISSNGVSYLEIDSAAGNLIFGNSISPNSIFPGTVLPGSVAQDPLSANKVNYLTFTGTLSFATGNGIFNDFDFGQLLPAGFSNLADLKLKYQVTGQQVVTVNFTPVPEPSSFVLAGLAGVAMVACARRRRNVIGQR